MSGEYFGAGNKLLAENLEDDKISDCPYGGDCPPVGGEAPDVKLHEMGEALEIAENRCNTLKEQLDHMKCMYREQGAIDDSCILERANTDFNRPIQGIKHKHLMRQKSGAIGTDNSGAAVMTINNILSGITNSINRLSELHTYIDEDKKPRNRKKRLAHTPQDGRVRSMSNADFTSDNKLDNCFPRSSSIVSMAKRIKLKKREKARRFEVSSATQVQPKPRAKSRGEEKGASNTSIKNRQQKKKVKKPKQVSRTCIVKKNKLPIKDIIHIQPDHLVELYHNKAVRESGSEESDQEDVAAFSASAAPPNTTHEKVKPKKPHCIPPLPITESKVESGGFMRQERSLSPIEENIDSADYNNRPDLNGLSRNYESPTISSRMKQVARGYFNHFAAKTIPFCAAKSTSPSHNIGINIQQVMNIMKTKQPIKGISPTLAHNIGLAADKLNHRSLSAMVSSLGSRIGYNCQMPCPMMRNNVNYQQLQEMAKDIPEEAEYEDQQLEERQDSANTNEPQVWAVDPNNQTCTCIPRATVGFQQIFSKYGNTAGSPICYSAQSQPQSINQSQYSQNIMRKSYRKYKHIRSVYAQYNDCKKKQRYSPTSSIIADNKCANNIPLMSSKEKVLKGVLINLHNEFAQLSEKYEEVSKNASKDENEENEELEILDKKLNEKEEEIQMVMSLYNEVVNLKQQVKVLRQKTSMASMVVEQQRQNYQTNMTPYYNTSPNKYRDTNAAVHLTKLLRQIQTYQQVEKTGGK